MERFLADHGPFVWHVAEAESVPGIRARGLLPANALLPTSRHGAWRAAFVQEDGAVLRFQQMSDARLLPHLRGRFAGRPEAWRAHIDSHVFFWCQSGPRDRFVAATVRERRAHWRRAGRAGSPPPPAILRFDLADILRAVPGLAYASLINSGSLVLGKTWRDEATLRPVTEWDRSWRTPGGRRDRQAQELAIRGPLPVGLRFGMEPIGIA